MRTWDESASCTRRWLGWFALTALALMLAPTTPVTAAVQAKKEVVVAAWGSSYEEVFRKTIIPEFEKRFGAKVVYVPGFTSQTMAKLVAQKDAPQIDVALFNDPAFTQARKQSLLAPLDKERVKNLEDMYDFARIPGDVGVGFYVSAEGIYYNTEIFKQKGWVAPTSWLDLFDPKHQGHLTVHSITNGIGLNFFLMVNKIMGGDLNNVEPGFAKVKTVKPNVIVFDKFAETPKLIQQRESWIGTWGSDRVGNLKATTGFPIAFSLPKEGAAAQIGFAGLVKGGPNPVLGNEFINMLISAEMASQFAKFLGFGPFNKKVQLDAETASIVVHGKDQLDRLVVFDADTVNTKRPIWTERWNKEIESQ